jgi:niacin transporter
MLKLTRYRFYCEGGSIMKSNEKIQKMCVAALLCAIGILIPIISPVKVQLGPMSFTLASHVAVFIAMFISPAVALTVEVGTTLGFLLAGFPPVVVLRAAAQIFFVLAGAFYLAKRPQIMDNFGKITLFGLILGAIHGAAEALVVTAFWFSGASYEGSFVYVVVGLVGVGTLVHSMVDYYIALFIWKAVSKAARIPNVSYKG